MQTVQHGNKPLAYAWRERDEMKLIVVAFMSLSFAAIAHAQSLIGWNQTGNDYVSTCRNIDDAEYAQISECFAFTQGVLNGFWIGAASQPDRPKGHALIAYNVPCVPDGVTNAQVVKVVLAFADKHPNLLHAQAGSIVVSAVVDAWGTTLESGGCSK
jgi:Rap1a immunity proteins